MKNVPIRGEHGFRDRRAGPENSSLHTADSAPVYLQHAELCSAWGQWQAGGVRLGPQVLGRRLGAAADVKLFVNVHQMGADGCVADIETRGDFLVGKPFG